MERLRRSFRDSFRKKKEGGLEASKPHQWQHDEAAVRAATCAFPVKVRRGTSGSTMLNIFIADRILPNGKAKISPTP